MKARVGVIEATRRVPRCRHECSGHGSWEAPCAPQPAQKGGRRTYGLNEAGWMGGRGPTVVAGGIMARSPSEDAWRRRLAHAMGRCGCEVRSSIVHVDGAVPVRAARG